MGQLGSFLASLKASGVRLSIITKGYVGACRYLLEQEGLLQHFEQVFGMLGQFYGESDFDRTNLEPSSLEGSSDYELRESKASLIRSLMSRESLAVEEACLVEDDAQEIASVQGICRSVFVAERRGMTESEMNQLRSLAGATAAKVGAKPQAVAATPPPDGFSGGCEGGGKSASLAKGPVQPAPPAGLSSMFKSVPLAAAAKPATALTAKAKAVAQGTERAQGRLMHVYFDFDQTLSKIHVLKQLAGLEPGVDAPHARSERGQIHRLKMLNAKVQYIYQSSNDMVVPCAAGAKGSSWTACALGGPERVGQLGSFLASLKASGVRLSIIAKGYVGACRYLLEQEGLLQHFEQVFGMLGQFYGESDLDRANLEPSSLEGSSDYELRESKASLIRSLMSRESLAVEEACLVEDDAQEIASVQGICRSVLVAERRGMTESEINELLSLAAAQETRQGCHRPGSAVVSSLIPMPGVRPVGSTRKNETTSKKFKPDSDLSHAYTLPKVSLTPLQCAVHVRPPDLRPTFCSRCWSEPACAFNRDHHLDAFVSACQTAQCACELKDLDELVHMFHDSCVHCIAHHLHPAHSVTKPKLWGLAHRHPKVGPSTKLLTGPRGFKRARRGSTRETKSPPQSGFHDLGGVVAKSSPGAYPNASLASLEALLKINPCQDETQPNWAKVAALIEGAIVHGCSAFEPRFLELAEMIERQACKNSLEWWLGSHLLNCAESSTSPAWAKPAALDLLSRQNGTAPTKVRIFSANITCWGPKIKDWVLTSIGSWDLLCIQETHLLKDIPNVEAALSSAALSHHFGPGQCSGKGGVLGGVLTVAPSHRNVRRVVEVMKEGCGFVGDELRLQGWSVVIFNVYLKSGSSLQGEINSEVLSQFLSLVNGLSVLWIAIGDFNTPAEEFASTSFPSEAKAELVSTQQPTTDHGATLDYALVSRELRGTTDISVCWDVPFKPHGLLQLCVDGSCDMPFPQLPRFHPLPDMPVRPFMLDRVPVHVQWDDLCVDDSASCNFAAWSAAVGLAFDISDGPGTNFLLSRKPLIRTHSPSRIWTRGDLAFWERIEAWTRKVQKQTWVIDKMTKPVNGLLSEVLSHWQSLEGMSSHCWISEAESIFFGRALPSQDWLDMLNHQCKAALTKQCNNKNLQYRDWLQGATAKGMRPLFRALKSEEATTIRPFRQTGLELRPYLRLEYWSQLWAAGPDPLPRTSDTLSAMARQHARSLPALDFTAAKKCLFTLSNKAGGADGWSYANLKRLPDTAFESLLVLMRDVELSGCIPIQWATTVVTMLPKNERVERPIALCHAAYRLWAKLRFDEVKAWLTTFTTQAPWEFALPGYSPLDVSIRRLVQAEVAKAKKRCRATIFIDLQTFYESICHSSLAAQAIAHSFPPVLVEVALGIYRGARYIVSEGVASPKCYASKGLMAGCPLAPSLAKLAVFPALQKLQSSKFCDHATVWLDDVSADSEGVSPADTALRSYRAFGLLKTEFQSDGLCISTSKTCWVVSDSKTAKALSLLRKDTEPPIRALARDLGTDYAAARRRRITVAQGREQKGLKRAAKLKKLRVPSLQHRWRAFRSGVFAASAWGHQAQGLAPKRLRWLRACGAQQLGRHKLGDLDVVFDFYPNFVDPLVSIIQEHLQGGRRVFGPI